MDIKLKQPDIEAALKAHIVSQGFNLTGKAVTIDFTAGRKAGGLIADVSIEDAAQAVKPSLGEQLNEAKTDAPAAVEAVAEVEAQPAAEAEASDPPSTTKASLFG